LLSVIAMMGVTLSTQAYATLSIVDSQGELPFAVPAAWIDTVTFILALALIVAIPILYPTGTPRWRWLWRVYIVALGTLGVSWALLPQDLSLAVGDVPQPPNPLGIEALEPQLGAIVALAAFTVLGCAALSILALVLRYREAQGDARQQIRWLAYVGVAAAVMLVAVLAFFGTVGDPPPTRFLEVIGGVLFQTFVWIVVFGIPGACGVAILKYHLYDLDVVIRKTVVFGLLAAFITVVYGAIVGLVSLRFEKAGSFVAAAALAILFAPARDRARKIADRLVYGKRATPYEVLAEFSDRVGEAYAAEDVLQRMAQVLMEGTGATGARVLLRVGAEQREAAAVGERGVESYVEVIHQGEELGALAVSMPASDPMNPAKRKLVEDLAAQAGLVLRNVKLIEELKASRQRLVAAQDEERRKIERNIHDGAQQQLVALSVQLKLAEQLAGKDTDRERELLVRLGARANEALEDLRDLARGIYPPLLADKGLAAALEAQARKAAVPTSVQVDGIGRYSQEIESTVYFCTLEALNNVAKYAEATSACVTLARSNSDLTFEVTDDGRGFDVSATSYGTGLQGIADRLAAIGGTLTVESVRGSGTTVSGRVPM
jgi:signal transduction histidine kinase